MEDRCICCGEIIPEGRQVCWTCEKGEVNNGNNRMHISCDCSSRIYGNCMGGKRRVGGEADDKERFRNSRPCFNTGHVRNPTRRENKRTGKETWRIPRRILPGVGRKNLRGRKDV